MASPARCRCGSTTSADRNQVSSMGINLSTAY
jgi:hypothetical protein